MIWDSWLYLQISNEKFNSFICAQARQNARSDRVCLDLSLLRFFVSRQRNEEIGNCIIGAVWCLERLVF
jgi:hypothetical protein